MTLPEVEAGKQKKKFPLASVSVKNEKSNSGGAVNEVHLDNRA